MDKDALMMKAMKVVSCRKNTIIPDIQSIAYMMIENMFMGAVKLSKKFFGNIWNIFKNTFGIFGKDNPIKTRVVIIKDKNVDHPAYAQQSEPFAQFILNTFK